MQNILEVHYRKSTTRRNVYVWKVKPLSIPVTFSVLLCSALLGSLAAKMVDRLTSNMLGQQQLLTSSDLSYGIFVPRRPPTEPQGLNTHPDYSNNGLVCCFKNHPREPGEQSWEPEIDSEPNKMSYFLYNTGLQDSEFNCHCNREFCFLWFRKIYLE